MLLAKVAVSSILISFVSWLSGRNMALAGFLTALPLTTLLALAFSQVEWADQKQSVEFAKSIFLSVPLTLTFFVPFLFAEKWNLSFWVCYILGIVFLIFSYFVSTVFSK